MLNYDFLVFSPFEFENFCRDLLQKKLCTFIESFTSGRDKGIDLRYTSTENETVIIQVKRYERYSDLLANLKKEKASVDKLQPTRYVLCTNVGLTPSRKVAIQKMFHPFISSTEDILGRTDLNNLLNQHKEVETAHYKLWLASTNVLNKILHSKIYNQSAFKFEEIKEAIKLYVPNNSFNEALHILKQHKYVIISGIPGIGKSTLSYMLVSYLLSSEYEEFVYLSQSINEGYSFFTENKKQVFLFDDFLGKNYFTADQEQNADENIVGFIKKIQRSSDKLFILATREYILRQARINFEAFSIYNIEMAKCILDLSSYTNIIKARILYQHLFFSDIPAVYLQDLLRDDNYLKLIRHKNYNPRVIETALNERIWLDADPSAFSSQLIGYFQNPQSVWLRSFEKSLDDFQRYCLLVLATMGTPVVMESLARALKTLLVTNHQQLNISYDAIKFDQTIRILENTFIATNKDKNSNIAIDYQNPSVQDFLVNYLRDKQEIIEMLLSSAVFYEQFFTIFRTESTIDAFSAASKILLKQGGVDAAVYRIGKAQLEITSARYRQVLDSNFDYTFVNNKHFKYQFIKHVFDDFSFKSELAKKWVYSRFQQNVYLDTTDSYEQDAYLYLLEYLDKDDLQVNEREIFDNFLKYCPTVEDLENVSRFRYIFPDFYFEVRKDGIVKAKIVDVIERDLYSIGPWELEDFKNKIEFIDSGLQLNIKNLIQEIDERLEEYREEQQAENNVSIRELTSGPDVKKEDEVAVIAGLFESLLQQKK